MGGLKFVGFDHTDDSLVVGVEQARRLTAIVKRCDVAAVQEPSIERHKNNVDVVPYVFLVSSIPSVTGIYMLSARTNEILVASRESDLQHSNFQRYSTTVQ